MISGGSWVFNKIEKGSNDVYARFRLKPQVETEEIVNRVSFEFSRLGGKKLEQKAHQAMDTETPLMLLFVCNGTEQASVMADTKQMLDLALDDIERNGMLPEEFEGKDIPLFTLRLNVHRVPSKRKSTTNKGYDHYKDHGRKHSTSKWQKRISASSSFYRLTHTGCDSTSSILANSRSSHAPLQTTPPSATAPACADVSKAI